MQRPTASPGALLFVSLILGTVALAGGIFGATLALRSVQDLMELRQINAQGVAAMGQITRISRFRSRSQIICSIAFTFVDANGRQVSHTDPVANENTLGMQAGDPVAVKYIPDNSDICRLNIAETTQGNLTVHIVIFTCLMLGSLIVIPYAIFKTYHGAVPVLSNSQL